MFTRDKDLHIFFSAMSLSDVVNSVILQPYLYCLTQPAWKCSPVLYFFENFVLSWISLLP